MDRNELFDRLMRLEKNVARIHEDMQELKALTVELVEENVALQIENDNFKALMQQEEEENIETPIEETRNATSQPTKKQLQSREYFAKLYHEGFHICHDVFGKHRHGEDCMFCLNVLNDK
ncbi:yabA [Staphylococcus schleiferi]|uniref:DNA replication initiation control protein YabA n=1 Tax=Staphylococcus coagulans TaxID=74706 RepID=A0A9X1EE40_9STAP|nr:MULTISPECIES: DNA replication initiation control protein YabA [Staphylococcus]NHA37373.1 DNA replication initiation control protein YabA [Staphylococcus schleiferi]MBA8760841.1 DNA replication initiation control protein YabA [Staphylococcus coagulans]MBA8769549.1 DNA replication initiation control protein YabA [Staphylococcus coagulans]MBA8772943.1 DNA replication initiation control protein YabA [Staphylococcus coagulans]MBA8776762.1 DNA replication initiation control protein YabA [Staphylo